VEANSLPETIAGTFDLQRRFSGSTLYVSNGLNMTRDGFDNNFSVLRFHESHGDFTRLERMITFALPVRDQLDFQGLELEYEMRRPRHLFKGLL